MTGARIVAIWWRELQDGEFFNMERSTRLYANGNGALYIEIPKGITAETLTFFDRTPADLLGGGFQVLAVPLGSTDGLAFPIDIKIKSSARLRIANQNRQATPNRRHPAWSSAAGFPIAPDDVAKREDAVAYLPEGGVRIFIAKDADGTFYAGYTAGPAPAEIADTSRLRRLYDGKLGGVIWDVDLPPFT